MKKTLGVITLLLSLALLGLHFYGVSVFFVHDNRSSGESRVLCVERTAEQGLSRSGRCAPKNGATIGIAGVRVFLFLNAGPPGTFTVTCRSSSGVTSSEFGYYTQHLSEYRQLPAMCTPDHQS
jgi:hypothetical protein